MTRRILGLMLIAVALMSVPMPARADDNAFPVPVEQVTGLAADSGRKAYWATGKAGGSVDAISGAGAKLGTIKYSVGTDSVQAVSFASNALYVADIGGEREQVKIVRLTALSYGKTATSATLRLRYPDGAHEAKAFAVSPKGNLYIVTAGSNSGIYRVTGTPSTTKVTAMERAGDAPDGVSDAVFLSDGSSLALRTAEQLVILDTQSWKVKASAALPQRGDSDALAIDLGGKGVVAVDSGKAAVVGVPTTVATVDPEPGTNPASPGPVQPSAQATADAGGASAVEPTGDSASRRGTAFALGGAVVLALAAAAVVGFRK